MRKELMTFLALAFVGAFLASVSSYIQVVSMDLARFPLSSYLATDPYSFAWWQAIGFPFLVGLSYIAVAVSGIRTRPGPRPVAFMLGACLVLALLLCVVSMGLGIFASVSLLALLFGPARTAFLGRHTNG